MDANKDRQEAAIYTFTVVTIIFLPLSFVSTFFGMNTVDVRSLEHSQWLFWVTAIPLAGFVIVACLFFNSDVTKFASWVRHRLPSRRVKKDRDTV